MKLPTVIATAALGLSFLACSSGGSSTDTQNDRLLSPWKEMNLPVGDGEILIHSDEQLLVGYETYEGGLSSLDTTWKGAVEAAGYSMDEDVSAGGVNAYIMKKGSMVVGLATLEEDGLVGAYLEDLGKVKDSQIRGGKVRDTVRSRRGGKAGGGKGGSTERGKSGGDAGSDRGGRGGGKGGKGGKAGRR